MREAAEVPPIDIYTVVNTVIIQEFFCSNLAPVADLSSPLLAIPDTDGSPSLMPGEHKIWDHLLQNMNNKARIAVN